MFSWIKGSTFDMFGESSSDNSRVGSKGLKDLNVEDIEDQVDSKEEECKDYLRIEVPIHVRKDWVSHPRPVGSNGLEELNLGEKVDCKDYLKIKVPLPIHAEWVPRPSTIIPFIPFTGQPGLRVMVPPDGNPIDYFYLLADESFLDVIIKETNSYAQFVLLNDKNLRDHPLIKRWKKVTKEEFIVFLALVFHMGTIQLPKMQDYWKTDLLYNFPCFCNSMSRNRFLLIMSCLTFPEDKQTSETSLRKIRPFVNFFNNKMDAIYSPEKNLTIHESMLLWKGRLSYREYVNKIQKTCGLKFYLLAECKGIILNAKISFGTTDNSTADTHGGSIVLSFMKDKMNKGHAVYLDKSYSSVSLAKTLLTNKTYCTGKLRPGKKNNPTVVVQATLKPGGVIARYCENICVGKWQDKSELMYISTEYKNELVEITTKGGQTKLKPKPIVEFNKNKLGFDLQDEMLFYYSSHRKAIEWQKKAGIYIIEMMLFNACMFYNKYSGKTKSLSNFREAVVDAMLSKTHAKSEKENKK